MPGNTLFICVLIAMISLGFKEQEKPTLFVIGDSTVRNGQGNGANGQWGWGSFIGSYFNEAKIRVENKALGGTSTRTFYNNPKLWQQILDNIKPGDFVIMQFGHNDASPIVDHERARGTIKGNGDEYEEVFNPLLKYNEMVYSYGFYLRRFVKNIEEKGATPVICSPIPRNRWDGDSVSRSEYAVWAREAAAQTGTAFIPLEDLVISAYEKMGKDVVNSQFFEAKDHTHTIEGGAKLNAELVANVLKKEKAIGLAKFMK